MKLNRRNAFNKKTIILFAIMFIGLGFAAISATLGINGLAKLGYISFDVHFENVEVKEGSMEARIPANINAVDNTQINFSLHLTTPGEYYEFETDIVNAGTLDAYLSSIELLGLDESTQKYLKVTYRYSNGGKIRINDLLKSGEVERIKVKVEFLYDIMLDDLPIEGTEIDFSLHLTYTQDNGTGRDRSEVEVNILGQNMIAYMDNMKSKYVTSATGVNFGISSSDTNGKGLYLRAGTVEDEYPIYYFRGGEDIDGDGVEDYLHNNVLFGGFCWKIVRTTEQGGTKIIYNGEPDSNNQCNKKGADSVLMVKAFNTISTSLAEVGYMYGTKYYHNQYDARWEDTAYIYGSDVVYSNGLYTLTNPSEFDTIANVKTKHYTCRTSGTTCSKVYYVYSFYNDKAYSIPLTNGKTLENIISESFENITDSAIKKKIDAWFENNLISQENKLEDAVWCNDRSIASGGYLKNSDLTIDSLGGTYFSGVETRKLNIWGESQPALKDEEACQNKNDRFTKNDTLKGNAALIYAVGLLTADEALVAGAKGAYPTSYLNTGQWDWFLTPYGAAINGENYHIFYSYMNSLSHNAANNEFGSARPSIVLKKDIVAISGDGSSTNPYIVE